MQFRKRKLQQYKLYFLILMISVSCIKIFPEISLADTTFPEQAERLQLVNAHLLDFRPNGAPFVLDRKWGIGLDLLVWPSIDDRVGNKDEDIDAPSVVPRPRARYHFNEGMFIGAAWLPPLEVKKFRANMFSLESGVNYAFSPFSLGLRVFAADGSVRGPVTDKDKRDIFYINRTGFDATAGYRYQAWTPYIGVGTGHLNTEFTIVVDGVDLKIENAAYLYSLIGVSYTTGTFIFTAEQYQTDTFLHHFALSLNYLFSI